MRPPTSLRLSASALAGTILALSWSGPAAAQDGAATGMGTVEEPRGESPTDLPPSSETDATPSDPLMREVQDTQDQPDLPPATPEFNADGERQIGFAADILSYDATGETVTAEGNVVLTSGDRSVRADTVTWNQTSGRILAAGNVRFVDENGNQLYSDEVELTDQFETGALQNLLLVLREGGRLAAESGMRGADGTVELTRAAYTACEVETPEGCPKSPSWRITAERVTYDPAEARVRFSGAYLELFGARILPLPGLTIRTDGGPSTGILIPDLRFSQRNGVEVSGSYYVRLAPNKDLTTSLYVFTEAPPMASAQWRNLTDRGAYQVTGYATYSRRVSRFTGEDLPGQSDPRGYVFANGKFQLSPEWSLTGSLRLASDRTFLRRYDISRDDRLRSTVNLERIDDSSYFSLAGWATQTLRLNQDQGQVPIALPVLDYRKRLADPVLGGRIELQANTLAVTRTEGQDTQRAFARAQWDLTRVTPLGQVVTVTAMARGDVYHSDQNELTATALYRGTSGWQGRGVALGAVDVQWPLVGALFGGTQVLTPRVQLVYTPNVPNLSIPNEDSRAIDLEVSNLFALNRFPGYDRVEDGARVTYGFDWELRRPGWEVNTTLGQSYRLDNDRNIFPDGTGLSDRLSDFVGRTQIRFRDFVAFTHRYRLDKDNFAVRRNEVDATIGSRKTYAEIGYLRLNRNISSVEDLQDREELRAAARVAFLNYWSVFGSGIFNLTDAEEDASLSSDGFQPIRTRLGIAYQDDCLELGLTWRRDYVSAGDARRGNTFQVSFALRNLGFR